MKGIVRSSKFRHVFGKAVRKDDHYDNLMPGTAGPDSNLCDVNSKFFGLPWRGGGGPFVVWPLSKTGRLPPDVPLCTGHGGPVMDLAFSPFHENIIASASDDTTVKIWDIPEGGPTEDMNTPSLNFSGHMKKVILVKWNPVADNILTSVSFDNTVKLWDVSRGVEAASYNDHPESIQAFDWNFCGSKYATYSKDKHVRIVDPRNNVAAACFDAGHQGTKGAKVCFLGDRRIFCTIGFSRQSERQMFFWDERDTSQSLFELTMDIASGTLMPFFDPDSSLLYLAGKGDTNIRYFEIDDVDPYQHFIGIFTGKEPQRGMCMAPKRTADVGNCEVARFMRLTQNGFEPLSFTVPRKGDHFQDDLYPDTFAGVPALPGSDWLSGQNARPVMMSLKPGDTGTRGVVLGASQSVDYNSGSQPSMSEANVQQVAAAAKEKAMKEASGDISRLEAEVAALQGENRQLKAEAQEAQRLKGYVAELEAKNARLEKQIAKMG